MSRIAASLLLLLALAPPAAADGVSIADAMRYVAGVEELRAEIDWYPQGQARSIFKAHHVKITALFRRAGPGQPPLLRHARIHAPTGPRFMIPGKNRELRELVVLEDGNFRAQVNGLITVDVPVRLTPQGGLILDMPLWLKDDHFTPEELGGGLTRWPPSLDDLLRVVTSPSGGGGHGTLSFQGGLTWKLQGTAAPFAFPLPIGEATAASTLQLNGSGEVRSDGRFAAPIGAQNVVFVRADLRRANLRNQGGQVTLFGGQVTYQGRYGLSAGQGRTRLSLDGQLDYALQLGAVQARTEAGTVTAEGGTLRGTGPLRGTIDAQGGQVAADIDAGGGTFTLDVNGPVTAQVQTGQAQLDLRGQGRLTAQGRVASAGLNGLGIEDVILGGTFVPDAGSTAVVAGTTLALDGDDRLALDARGDATLGADGVRVDGQGHLDASGTLEARTTAGQATVTGQLALDGTVTTPAGGKPQLEASGALAASFQAANAELAREQGQVHVGSLDGTLQLDIALSDAALRATGGQLEVTAHDVRVVQPAQGGATPTAPPVAQPVPATSVPGQETVTVVAGDTLWALSQRFGVTVDALRAANGLGAHHVIQPGDVLVIPGSQPISTQPAPPPPPPAEVYETPSANRLTIDEARVAVDLDGASWSAQDGLRVDGQVRGLVVLSAAEVATARFEGALLGAVEAQLPSTQVGLTRSPSGQLTLAGVDSLAIPFALRLDAGTWVRVPGQVQGRLDRPGSEVRGVAHLTTGPDGKLQLARLEQVEATLLATGLNAEGASLPQGATLQLNGRAVLRPDGLDLFGSVAVTVTGDAQTPILSVTW